MKPIRIQRKRTKGWRMPENTIYVGRPSKWGNPIQLYKYCIYINESYRKSIGDPLVYFTVGDIEDVIYYYAKLWDGTKFYDKDLQYWSDHFKSLDLNELRGKNLACWCALDEPCHADVLLRLANEV